MLTKNMESSLSFLKQIPAEFNKQICLSLKEICFGIGLLKENLVLAREFSIETMKKL